MQGGSGKKKISNMKKGILILSLAVAALIAAAAYVYINAFGDTTYCRVEQENKITSRNMSIHGRMQIDLADRWDEEDTFYFHNLSTNYRSEDVHLDIVNNGDELVSATTEVLFVPSVWCDMEANVIQFIELRNLANTISSPLDIRGGVVVYPYNNPCLSSKSDIDALFANITRREVLASIKQNHDIESHDKAYYMRYARDYKPGKLTFNSCDKYDVLDVDYSIVLKYRGASGEYTKRICYTETHGN